MRKFINNKASQATPARKAVCLLTAAALVATMGFGTALAAGGSDSGDEPQIASTTTLSSSTQAGDKVWIKSGSLVYKGINGSEAHQLLLKYQIEIKSVTTDDAGNPLWYEFEFVGKGLGEWVLQDFHYVKAESTSATEPVDGSTSDDPEAGGSSTVSGAPACDCGSSSDDISKHVATCARYTYIMNLVGDKTAEQIYENWDSYDAQTRTDIKNYLQSEDNSIYQALLALIAGSEGDGFDVKYVDYSGGNASNNVSASASAPEGTFPAGTQMSVRDADVSSYEAAINTLVGAGANGDESDEGANDSTITGIVAVDIEFTANGQAQQPSSNVVVTMNVPAGEEALEGANMVHIVHIGADGPELVTTQYLSTATEGQSITFGASSFSSYAAVFVDGKYSSKKLSEVLKGNEHYSIKEFGVNLFDYTPDAMNTALKNVAAKSSNENAKGDAFLFRGYVDQSGITGTAGINDSSSEYAKQGVVRASLSEDGLPVFNYIGGESSEGEAVLGTATGKVLFSTAKDDEVTGGKKTYEDAKLQFVYDSETGYYTYKSSANHAQYNAESNTIELYADTLSTQNKYVDTLDLTSYSGVNGYNKDTIDTTGGSFKATAEATTNSDGTKRFDPYVRFDVPEASQAAENINKIYIKAKIPQEVGRNAFQLFFTSGEVMNETESFVVEYTANGDWIEFVIDTKTCSSWTEGKKITQLRIDLFDTNQGDGKTALEDTSKTYGIEIAQISLITENPDYVTYGGFYPFSEIEDSYPGNGSQFDRTAWEKNISSDASIGSGGSVFELASRSIFNPDDNGKTTSAESQELTDNLFFGMAMEFDFYIPVGGKVDGESLKYTFTGDDDLWVFVDGKLVLDIGGGHGAITGTVDFTEGKSTVNSAATVTGYNSLKTATITGENGSSTTATAVGEKTTTLSEDLCSAGKHTMKIFYMERCGSVSNCFMKFNLPTVPQGDVVVSKAVQDENGKSIDKLKDETYTFTISGTSKDGKTSLDTKELQYKLFDSTTGKYETKRVDEGGVFTLTATQTATFDIDENYNVIVAETAPLADVTGGYEYKETQVDNVTKKPDSSRKISSDQKLTTKDGELKYAFTNIYGPVYGNLKIIKSGIEDSDNGGGRTQSSVFRVTGTSDSGVEVDMEVTIVGNGSRLIKHLPVGTYTVTEATDWSWRYDLQSVTDTEGLVEVEGSIEQATVKKGGTPEVTFTNDRRDDKWLSGDSFCRNLWGKDGIVQSTTQPGSSAGSTDDAPTETN